MSLRQRGQRPSESSNEGFSPYSSGGNNDSFMSGVSNASGADHQLMGSNLSGVSINSSVRMVSSPTPPRPPLPRSPPPPSAGSFQGNQLGTPVAPSPSRMMGYQSAPGTGGSHGSYYGTNMGSPSPSMTPPIGVSAAGGGMSTTPVRPPASAYSAYSTPHSAFSTPHSTGTPSHQGGYSPYPSTAPPAYNTSSAAPSPIGARTLNFSEPSVAGGGGVSSVGVSGGSSYENPYQNQMSIKKKSGGVAGGGGGFSRILLGVFLVASLSLSSATFYFRRAMLQTQTEIDKVRAESKLMEQGRPGRNRRRDKDSNRKMDRKDARRLEREERKRSRDQRRNDQDRGISNSGVSAKAVRDLQMTNDQLESELNQIAAEFEAVENSFVKFNAQLENLENARQGLLHNMEMSRHELEHAEEEVEKYKAMLDGRQELEVLMHKRESALWKRIDGLREKIGRESRREAEERFGPGPHRVEFEMEYPQIGDTSNPESWSRVRKSFVIELASLHLMPHTVNFFLQQVDHKLWDGCALNRNAHHIFYFGPPPPEEDGQTAELLQRFIDSGLDKISYQEYSAEYPHLQWTVGIAGRPGGPDFYINKLNNSIIHGPGGQLNSNDMHSEADPCFGKIVEGMDVINDINKVPTDADHDGASMYPIVITQAKIVDRVEPGSRVNEEKAQG